MPRIETHNLNDTAILWPAADGQYDSDGTQKVSGTYQEVSVRWQETRREVQNEQGEIVVLDVTVVIGQDVAIGSLFWLGAETDLPDPVTDVTNLYKVVTRGKNPNLRGGRYRRTLGLQRYSNKLPPTT